MKTSGALMALGMVLVRKIWGCSILIRGEGDGFINISKKGIETALLPYPRPIFLLATGKASDV